MADVFKTTKITQAVPGGPLQDQLVGAISVTSGTSADANKVILTDASGMLDASFGGGGGGTSVYVNAVSVSNPNFNDITPAAPGGYTNVLWQQSGSNVSAYYQTSGGSTAFQVNGVAVSSSATINFENGTDITVSNPSAGNIQFAFTGTLATTFSPVSNEFLTSYNASTGLFTASTVAYSGITGTPTVPSTFSPVTNEFLTSYDASTGLFTGSQPSFGNISGTVAVGQLSGTYNISITGNAATATTAVTISGTITGSQVTGNISGDAASITGTITYAQVTGIPAFPVTIAAVSHEWLNSYTSTTGLFTQSQPASTDLSDAASLAYLASPSFTGTASFVNVHITGTLEDGASSVGTSGQVLSSTVTGVAWVTPTSGSTTLASLTDVNLTSPTNGQVLTYVTPTNKWENQSLPITSYATTIGDGSSLTYTITHNLGTDDVVVQVYNISTGETDIVDSDRISTNAVTVTFAVAPSSNSERVVVLSSGGSGSSSGGGGIYPTLTPPVSTNFTWNNPSSFPETTTDLTTKMLVVFPSAATGLWLVQNTALPATPYTLDLGSMYFGSNNINVVSILLSNSGLTNARVWGSRVDSESGEYGAWTIVDQSWSGPVSPGSENFIYSADGMSASQHIVFTRVTNDGTNINVYWSANGENFILLNTLTVASLGFSPTTTGIVFYNTSGAMNVWCYHWLVSGSILPQNS